jgi:hypothetical protein
MVSRGNGRKWRVLAASLSICALAVIGLWVARGGHLTRPYAWSANRSVVRRDIGGPAVQTVETSALERIGGLPPGAAPREDGVLLLRFIDERTGWLLSGSQLWLTQDGGLGWTNICNLQNGAVQDFEFLDKQHGWFIASGQLHATTNGGYTWQLLKQPIPPPYDGDLQAFGFAGSGSHLWVAGSMARRVTQREIRMGDFPPTRMASADGRSGQYPVVFVSRDGGKTWKQQPTPLNWGYITELLLPDPGHGWALGVWNVLKLDRDRWRAVGGTNDRRPRCLEAEIGVPTIQPVSVFFLDTRLGWVSNLNGYVGRSTDGGETWEDIFRTPRPYDQSAAPGYLVGFEFTDASRGLAIDDKGAIYRTRDGGSSWDVIAPNMKLNTMYFLDPRHGWAVDERSLYRIVADFAY